MNIISEFLNIVLINQSWIFLNIWSFIHLISGFILMYLLLKYKEGNPLITLFSLLLLYELFEIFTILIGLNLFISEIPLDILFDLIYGMLGGFISYKILKK